MNTPNLFILGAPKCGTTALAQWLSVHPDIYAPPAKEPHYFSKEYCLTPDRADYEWLYRRWSSDIRWAFDASVWSLFSPTAVPNILQERPDARFVVMLRNPLQMIPSMHRQQVFNGNELEPDLGAALAMSDRRAVGDGISVLTGYPPDHLAYYSSCALGWQVKRLMSRIENGHVHFIIYDDLVRSPENVLTGVYRFIGLDPLMPITFDKINASKVRRFPRLDKVAKSFGDWKHRRDITLRLGFVSWLRRVNQKQQPIPPLNEDLAAGIRDRLADDVLLLGNCLGRDMSHWIDAPALTV